MADLALQPIHPATATVASPPPAHAVQGQNIPETDPSYLAFANGQGFREAEARSYTALRQNAVHQQFQDQLPAMILAGQQQMVNTTNQFADKGAWRTGARIQQQGRDYADLQNKVTDANDRQQQQQNDLAAQLAAHVANLRMDTSQARLEAANAASVQSAALGQGAYVNQPTATASTANQSLPGAGQ